MLIGTTIQARDLDKQRYYRLTNRDECHRGMRYNTGKNTDILPFNPANSCCQGGLYFFSEQQLPFYSEYVDDACWIREVTFDDPEELIYVEEGKYKTHSFVLGERQKFIREGMFLKYIPRNQKTYDVCLAAVKYTGNALCHVPSEYIDENMCCTALEDDRMTADIMKQIPFSKRSYRICMKAVEFSFSVLKYIPEEHKTLELCMIASGHLDSIESFNEFIPRKYKKHEFFVTLKERLIYL
jgi:hypothetical protein